MLSSGLIKSSENLAAWRPLYGFIISINGLLNPLVNYGRNKDVRKVVRALICCPERARRLVPFSIRETGQSHSDRDAAVIQVVEKHVQCSTDN